MSMCISQAVRATRQAIIKCIRLYKSASRAALLGNPKGFVARGILFKRVDEGSFVCRVFAFGTRALRRIRKLEGHPMDIALPVDGLNQLGCDDASDDRTARASQGNPCGLAGLNNRV